MESLNQDNFIECVFTSDPVTVVVVEFSADWCSNCEDFQHETLPELEEIYSKNKKVIFYNLDVDEAVDISDQYSIDKLPTFLFFRNRNVENFIIGNESVETFKRIIDDLLEE